MSVVSDITDGRTRKHSPTFASGLSGTDKSAFSKFLMNDKDVTKYALEDLSKKQAKIYSEVPEKTKSLPWRVFILTDSTMQSRCSLKSENVRNILRIRHRRDVYR